MASAKITCCRTGLLHSRAIQAAERTKCLKGHQAVASCSVFRSKQCHGNRWLNVTENRKALKLNKPQSVAFRSVRSKQQLRRSTSCEEGRREQGLVCGIASEGHCEKGIGAPSLPETEFQAYPLSTSSDELHTVSKFIGGGDESGTEHGANPNQNPNSRNAWAADPALDPAFRASSSGKHPIRSGSCEPTPQFTDQLHRSLALACAVILVTTAASASLSGVANAAEPKRRNKLKEQRLAWEKSLKQQGGVPKKGGVLGGFVNVSKQDKGPAKVDIDIEKGAKYVRGKVYKARYFTDEAIEEFRGKLRRTQLVSKRRPNFFRRNRELTSAIQLGLSLALLIVAVRWLFRLAKKERWGWPEWWRPYKPRAGSRVRDRSLGGKEVVVGNQWEWPSWLWGGEKTKFRRQTLGGVRKGSGGIETVKHANPLDYEVDVRSEKELRLAKLRQEERRAASERRRQIEELPGWWPRESLLPPVKISEERKQVGRSEAQQVLQRLVNKRVVGQDPSLEDIEELHETCQRYSVSVTFDATSTQESIYRVAVQHKLAQLMRAARYETIELSLRPSTRRFVGLLAGDLGISPRRAVDLVESIIAAKTKASFIQAYALLRQGRAKDLQQELAGLAFILSTFPLPLDSAKLELVGDGLSARISSEERRELLQGICAVIDRLRSSDPTTRAEGSSPSVENISSRALALPAS